MGSVSRIFSPPRKPKSSPIPDQPIRQIKMKAEDEKRKKMAFKLAQIATGAKGILSDAETSRKKLLGN